MGFAMPLPALLPLVMPSHPVRRSAVAQPTRKSAQTDPSLCLNTKCTNELPSRTCEPEPRRTRKLHERIPISGTPEPDTTSSLEGSTRMNLPAARSNPTRGRPGHVHARHQRRNESEPRHPLPVPAHERRGAHEPARTGLGAGVAKGTRGSSLRGWPRRARPRRDARDPLGRACPAPNMHGLGPARGVTGWPRGW